jgi:hypothetical protein
MNIIYLECKILDITKRGFDFIGMSVFNQFLKVVVVSFAADEAWMPSWGVKPAEAGMAAAAGGGALCFLLCSIGE